MQTAAARALATPNEKAERKSPLQLCEDAWTYVERSDKRALEKFTRGVLKLPVWHWTAVATVLHEGRWRNASTPLAYVRSASVSETKRVLSKYGRTAPPARGRGKRRLTEKVYIWEGKSARYEEEAVPIDKLHGACLTIIEDFRVLAVPIVTEAPKTRKRRMGSMEAGDFLTQEEGTDEDNYKPTVFDKCAFREWCDNEHRTSKEKGRIDWYMVADRALLDGDVEMLFWARLGSGTAKRTMRDWTAGRLNKTEKRFRRKFPAIREIIRTLFS